MVLYSVTKLTLDNFQLLRSALCQKRILVDEQRKFSLISICICSIFKVIWFSLEGHYMHANSLA